MLPPWPTGHGRGALGTESAADRAVPGWELRAAAAGRSLAADPHAAEAGTRAEDDRIDERLIAGALQGFAQTLEPQVQGYLSRLLDLRIPAVRIHTGQAADAAARRLNADAVSFGRSIMFRAGKFDPDSAAGLGLLGHELTHVAQAAGAESDRSAGARIARRSPGMSLPRSRTKGASCSTHPGSRSRRRGRWRRLGSRHPARRSWRRRRAPPRSIGGWPRRALRVSRARAGAHPATARRAPGGHLSGSDGPDSHRIRARSVNGRWRSTRRR